MPAQAPQSENERHHCLICSMSLSPRRRAALNRFRGRQPVVHGRERGMRWPDLLADQHQPLLGAVGEATLRPLLRP
jgi:hypothetical protein